MCIRNKKEGREREKETERRRQREIYIYICPSPRFSDAFWHIRMCHDLK